MAPSRNARKWKRREHIVVATIVFHAIAMAAAVPIIPLSITQLGVRSSASAPLCSGLVLTISPFFAAILAPVWGALADRYGLKPMALRAQFASAFVLFGMAFVPNVAGLPLLRAGWTFWAVMAPCRGSARQPHGRHDLCPGAGFCALSGVDQRVAR